MNKLGWIAVLSLLPSVVHAAPFLRCDAVTDLSIDAFVYQEGSSPAVSTPLVNGACKADMAGVSVGAHTLQTWFTSSLWGSASAKVPFTFTRPAAIPTGPANLLISQ